MPLASLATVAAEGRCARRREPLASPGPTTPAIRRAPTMSRALFDRQLQDQLDAGPPDFWIGRRSRSLGEALLFVERAKATGLPVMATMCFETLPARSRTRATRPASAAKRLGRRGRGHRRRELPRTGRRSSSRSPSTMVEAVAGAVPVASQPVGVCRPRTAAPDFTRGPSFPYALTPMTLARARSGQRSPPMRATPASATSAPVLRFGRRTRPARWPR